MKGEITKASDHAKEASDYARKQSDAARESSDRHSVDLAKMQQAADNAAGNLKTATVKRRKRKVERAARRHG